MVKMRKRSRRRGKVKKMDQEMKKEVLGGFWVVS